jgi:hypothetical protein
MIEPTKAVIYWPAYYQVRAYCTCGDAVFFAADNITQVQDRLIQFMEYHSDDGHKPCDARTCLKARRKRGV